MRRDAESASFYVACVKKLHRFGRNTKVLHLSEIPNIIEKRRGRSFLNQLVYNSYTQLSYHYITFKQ